MKLDIKDIKSGCTFYKVEYPEEVKDEKNKDLFGRVFFDKDSILICSKYPYQEQLKALLHECIHTILDNGVIDVDENEIRLFTNLLHSFIIDNPKLFKLLIEYRGEDNAEI